MRFMIMHKNDPLTEAEQLPPKDVVEKMSAFVGEQLEAGRYLDGAGLAGSKDRTRLTFRDGRCTAKRGSGRPVWAKTMPAPSAAASSVTRA